ncbi:Bromodomain testis-specific protein [Sarcoptes scabiei]|uniref:Bromodomain testis-specific protein n=1 Tax=Sarcoptes scabiei TaxID=52283 RepID=A0A834RHE6_SARSC|nr:Bromodomain testis-specific protein [Sarcoptes scabiei]
MQSNNDPSNRGNRSLNTPTPEDNEYLAFLMDCLEDEMRVEREMDESINIRLENLSSDIVGIISPENTSNDSNDSDYLEIESPLVFDPPFSFDYNTHDIISAMMDEIFQPFIFNPIDDCNDSRFNVENSERETLMRIGTNTEPGIVTNVEPEIIMNAEPGIRIPNSDSDLNDLDDLEIESLFVFDPPLSLDTIHDEITTALIDEKFQPFIFNPIDDSNDSRFNVENSERETLMRIGTNTEPGIVTNAEPEIIMNPQPGIRIPNSDSDLNDLDDLEIESLFVFDPPLSLDTIHDEITTALIDEKFQPFIFNPIDDSNDSRFNVENSERETLMRIGTNAEPGIEMNAEPGIKINVEPEIETNVDHEIKMNIEPRIEMNAEPVIGMNAEPGIEMNAEPEIKMNAEPGIKMNAEPGIERNAEPEIKMNAEPGIEMNVEPEIGTNAESGIEMNAEPEIGTNAEPGIVTNFEPGIKMNAEPEIKMNVEPEIKMNVEPEIGTNAEPGIITNVKSKIGTNAEPGIKMDVELEIGTNAEPGIGTNAEPEIGTNVEPEIKMNAEPEIKMDVEPEMEILITIFEPGSSDLGDLKIESLFVIDPPLSSDNNSDDIISVPINETFQLLGLNPIDDCNDSQSKVGNSKPETLMPNETAAELEIGTNTEPGIVTNAIHADINAINGTEQIAAEVPMDSNGTTVLPNGIKIVNGVAQMPFDRSELNDGDQSTFKPRFTNQLQFLQKVVIRDIFRNRSALPFLKPFNCVRSKEPSYYDIIMEPMDFTTIKKRLIFLWYQSADECIDDIRQIFINCFRFNSPSHHVYLKGKKLQDSFLRKLAKMPAHEEEIDCPPKPSLKKYMKKPKKISLNTDPSIDPQRSKRASQIITRSKSGIKIRKPKNLYSELATSSMLNRKTSSSSSSSSSSSTSSSSSSSDSDE